MNNTELRQGHGHERDGWKEAYDAERNAEYLEHPPVEINVRKHTVNPLLTSSGLNSRLNSCL